MKEMQMQEILDRLNKEWKLDFVSATSGDCCNTCGDMRTPADTERWEAANTYLVVKWFFDGMNYEGEFEDMDSHCIKYRLGTLPIEKVCEDLREALKGHYEVINPESDLVCITILTI